METGSVDIYVAGFVERCDVMRQADQLLVRTPGAHGLLPSTDAPVVRLLVADDRAYDILAAALHDARAGVINVFATAERCAALVDSHPAGAPDQATAMVCGDLQAVPVLRLPSELTLLRVARLADDPADGVPLEDAVAAAMLASPRATIRPTGSPTICARCRLPFDCSQLSTGKASFARPPHTARSAARRV